MHSDETTGYYDEFLSTTKIEFGYVECCTVVESRSNF